MSITQTVDIPANRRLTVDVPREIPEGRTILIFKPIPKAEPVSIKALRGTLHSIDTTNLRDKADRPL